MATTTKLLYASSANLTITLNSLANNAARLSTVIDNSTNLYIDALVGVKIKTNGTLGSGAAVNVYVYSLVDGTNYTDQDRMGTAGTDSAFTLGGNVMNVKFIGSVNINTNAVSTYGGLFSVAAAFGGSLPQKWGVIIENQTGATLDGSNGGTVSYTGVQLQSV